MHCQIIMVNIFPLPDTIQENFFMRQLALNVSIYFLVKIKLILQTYNPYSVLFYTIISPFVFHLLKAN